MTDGRMRQLRPTGSGTLFIILFLLSYALLSAYTEVPKVTKRIVSGVVATAPVLLLLLGSLGQLTGKDTLLSMLLAGGLTAYISRAALNHSSP